MLLLSSACAQGQAPNVNYSGPLTITRGGTYSGNYRSTDSSVPVVRIQTTEPVILENCTLVGPGTLIYCLWDNVDLTVRECKGYGTTPTADNVEQGAFLYMLKAKNLVCEHNYLEGNKGIVLDRWLGNGQAGQTVKVRYNKASNLIGVTRNNPHQGLGNFVILNTIRSVPNMEIAWNQVINEPNKSRVEDNINIYDTSGTPSSPVRVHDNYVQGAYPLPATDAVFNGTGMTTDGQGLTAALATGYVEIDHNQFVSTCNGGINLASGHDITVHDNRVVTSGYLPNGDKLQKVYCGINPFNFYHVPAGAFGNISITNNTVGYANWYATRPYPNRFDIDPQFATTVSGNVSLPPTVTVQTEANEWTLWQQKLQQNSVVPGPTGSATPTTPPVATTPTTTPTTDTGTGAGTTPTLTTGATFYRAFNLNGPAVSLDGNSWESGTASGLTITGGTPFASQNVTLNPATDATRASMIRSSVYSNAVTLRVTGVPSGTYQVYLYTWEDNSPETFSIALNGVTQLSNYNSGAAGRWQRLGPYAATVTNGTIQLSTSGGAANCSGLEIWRGAGTATTTPVTTTPVATTPAASTYAFYRAIDLNGVAATIDGNSWEGSSAPNFGIYGTTSYSNQSQQITPATDAARLSMLRSCQYSSLLDFRLTAVPSGTYQVYAYVWEDNGPETFNVALNGQTVASNLSTGAAATWKKIGPYQVTVTDGTIRLTTSGGTVNLSGVEVWRQTQSASRSTLTADADPNAPTLYPNPLGQGQTQVQLSATFEEAQQVVVNVLSQMGTVLLRTTLNFPAGTSSQPLNVGTLAEGTYIVRFASGSLSGTTINLLRQN